jgi:hypothetical protein
MHSTIPPTTQYMFLVGLASLTAMGVGAVLFLPRIRPVELLREFVSTDWKYIGVAWVVTFVANELAHRFRAERTFTGLVYAVEGPAVAAFQTVTAPALTAVFTAVYLVGLPFIALFTYFKLKAHDEGEARRYALAYVCLVVLATPFFLLFPVSIPALYPGVGVEGLAFELSPVIEAGMFATDTMVKAFPSLHTGLSVLAALYARKAGTRYAWVATALAGAIVLSTFYLGIHWIVDAVAAVLLVLVAYWISRRVDPERLDPRRLPASGLRRLRS